MGLLKVFLSALNAVINPLYGLLLEMRKGENLRGIRAKPASEGKLTILLILPVCMNITKFEREGKSTSGGKRKSMATLLSNTRTS